jgi:hypothetical protein
MATLVLTTVGTALGGPIGGAVGALIGQVADTRLFAPRRRGPRLGDLAVQTSTYGSAIPKLFGTMRVAGTVIWATELKEDTHREGGGKMGPKTTRYSYSASFAVVLSGRAILGVGRIWADGKLLRGAAGDWKSETGFRLYRGSEDQPVDPLIAAIEGVEAAPAYRGTAYAVFEDLQLEDFGNRIPSLSFEVIADQGPVPVAAIASALSGGAVIGTTGAVVDGYAAGGESVRAAIETLAAAMPLTIADDGSALVITDAPRAPILLPAEAMGAGAGSAGRARQVERQASGAIPDEVAIAYHAPERDWQPGLQRARRAGHATRTETIELPAALPAAAAKALAERALAERWAGRVRARIDLPWRWLDIRPGEGVSSLQQNGHYRVARWTLEHMVLSIEAVRETADRPVAAVASPGRARGGPDLLHGPTLLHVLDLPLLDDAARDSPRLWIAAAGAAPGWRRAALSTSLDGGRSWQAFATTAAPATMGVVNLPPGRAGSALFDLGSSIEVTLAHAGMWLEPRDDLALAAGANLALIGDELVQFGAAEPLGSDRFRLTRLLRGRRGTEWASGDHRAGERFVMIEPAALIAFDPPADAIGGRLRVMASGMGDAEPALGEAGIDGAALRPPAPVALRAATMDDDTLAISWTRRSRLGFAWRDGGDAPLGEEAERYRLTVTAGGARRRTIDLAEPRWTYPAADMAADAALGPIGIAVVQRGTHAASRAAVLSLTP